MTGGMHVAGGAMANFATRHDVISHNVANSSTNGFARQDTFLRLLESPEVSPYSVPQLETRLDFTPGIPIPTGNHLDLSLEGTGFFTVQTEQGVRLTRVASLQVDREGILQTNEGHALLGENGLLFVGGVQRDGNTGDIVVEKDGTVFVDGAILDRLMLATFRSGNDVEREPGGLYVARPGRRNDELMIRPIVHSGQIEGSAVQPVDELVQMIQAMRAYDAAASALRATDNSVDKAVNDIARV